MKNKRFKIDPRKQIGAKSNVPFFIFVAFAAILSALVLGYLRFSDYGSGAFIGIHRGGKVLEGVPNDSAVLMPSPAEQMKERIAKALPDDARGMVFPSSKTQIHGRWYTHIAPQGVVEVTFMPDSFEIIYVDSPDAKIRKYSKGQYSYDPQSGDLGLFPVRGTEPSEEYQYKGMRYEVLTMRNFQMRLLQKQGEAGFYMVAKERDLAGKNYHPLFFYEAYDGTPVFKFMPVDFGREK